MSGNESPFLEDQQKVLKSMMADVLKEVLQGKNENSHTTIDDWPEFFV